jgi:hypothetical protein
VTVAFEERRWTGVDGLQYVLESFTVRSLGVPDKGCAKLYRKGLRDSKAAMRLEIDDLGVLAMHAREAFMEAIGRVSLEVTAPELKVHDAIEGLGEIQTVEGFDNDLGRAVVIATIVKSETQVVFRANDEGRFDQLIDITRDKVNN